MPNDNASFDHPEKGADNTKSDSSGSTSAQLKKTTLWLEENSRIGSILEHHTKYRRYVMLRTAAMFDSLVEIYFQVFIIHWNRLRHMAEPFTTDMARSGYTNAQQYTAAVYISGWFHDLYVSNRQCTYKLCDEAYQDHFHLDITHKSQVYDAYLALLNSHIRPTNIKLNHEDALYIPKFCENVNARAADKNFFGIPAYVDNTGLFHAVIYYFNNQKGVRMEMLSDNNTGRPSWLFDWHADELPYAWFPEHENYDMTDVAVGYILGVACTSKLGPRDPDNWRVFSNNTVPRSIDISRYTRSVPLVYRGAVEVNTIETRNRTFGKYDLERIFEAYSGVANQVFLNNPTAIKDAVELLKAALKAKHKADSEATKRKKHAGKTPPGKSKTKKKTIQIGSGSSDKSATEELEFSESEEDDEEPTFEEDQTIPSNALAEISNEAYRGIQFGPIYEFRIVTYLYHRKVAYNNDASTRYTAAKQIIHKGETK